MINGRYRPTSESRSALTRAGGSSGWGDDGRPAATDEANRQNLPRDRRAEPSGEMQRRAVAYRRHHGIAERGVVGPAAARPYEDDPRLMLRRIPCSCRADNPISDLAAP